MSFSSENGYVPTTVEDMMLSVMDNVNDQFGTEYTAETFIGTNFYKYFYALIQRLQENEIKTSEIFVYLQQYFETTNELISRPVVTNPGLVEVLLAAGYTASVKKPIDADAGKVYVCVDTDEEADDYEDVQLAINTIIKNSTVAGVVSQGTESNTIVLSNGQSFDFKYNLPTRTEIDLRLTITLSENNQLVVGNPDDTKNILLANIAANYGLGKNFEPQKYFGVVDVPWCSKVLLEYDAGAGWVTSIFDADYDEVFVCLLENVELIES